MEGDILKFAEAMQELIRQSNGKDNGEIIKEGDFGYFRTNSRPRIFLKHRHKDFVEAYCLCPQCHNELIRNEKVGFGCDVNKNRSEYVVVGNFSQFNAESL